MMPPGGPRTMRTLFVLVAAASALAAAFTPTVLVKKDLAELCAEAELVLVGRVTETLAAWNRERTLIWTESRIDVREVWKGEAPARLPVFEPGGEVGRIGQMVPGMARYRPGDVVVV